MGLPINGRKLPHLENKVNYLKMPMDGVPAIPHNR